MPSRLQSPYRPAAPLYGVPTPSPTRPTPAGLPCRHMATEAAPCPTAPHPNTVGLVPWR